MIGMPITNISFELPQNQNLPEAEFVVQIGEIKFKRDCMVEISYTIYDQALINKLNNMAEFNYKFDSGSYIFYGSGTIHENDLARINDQYSLKYAFNQIVCTDCERFTKEFIPKYKDVAEAAKKWHNIILS